MDDATTPHAPQPAVDTPAGAESDASYDTPGTEDEAPDQAVDQDRVLADRLMAEEDGDAEATGGRSEA